MIRLFKEPSIHKTTLIVILFAAVFAIISAFVVIYNESLELKREITIQKQRYIQTKKDSVLKKTATLYKLLEFTYKTEPINKQELKNLVESVFEDPFENQYVFVYKLDKSILYDPYAAKDIKAKLSTFMSDKDEKVIEKLKALASEGGGFYRYSIKGRESLIFVRINRELDWVIGSGIWLDDFEAVVNYEEEKSHKKITSFILKILTLTLFLYLAGILKYKYVTERISKELKVIADSFKEASKTYKKIDDKTIKFEEFKEITAHANKMIAKIKEKNTALVELNENLEKIVDEKTKALKKSVAYTEELLQHQDRFVKNAIHEINTPLTIILMNIELYNLKNERNPYLTKIEAAVKVLENIYEDLAYVVKKNRVEYTPININLSDFLNERISYFQDVAEGNDVSFTCKVEKDLHVNMNEIELQRVVDNNLSNAIKYATLGSDINVLLKEEGAKILFSITNDGETIESVDKLFERYYREDKARGGFGLGLNIVKEICEKDDVDIHVDSNNKKTTFAYRFKRA